MYQNFILKISGLLLLAFGTCNAQQAISTSGGNASGSSGSASYTIGQISTYTYSASGVFITEGVQQQYEIIQMATIDNHLQESKVSLYPNPVDHFIFIDFNQEKYANSNYELYDLQGRLIQSGKLTQQKTQLNMEKLSSSTYVIKIIRDNETIKTFKIIKK